MSFRYSPLRTSIISSLEIAKREFRLDPTRFNEKGERIIRHFKFQGIKTLPLGDFPGVTHVFIPPRFKRPYVDTCQYGTPFLGSSSMLALRLPTNTVLSPIYKKLKSLILKSGEILLSCSGTIGVSVLCGTSYRDFAVSQHAARIFAKESTRGYLHAYLSTSIGRELVLQQNYGKVIKELTEDQIKRVPVPELPGPIIKRINDAMLYTASLYDEARNSLEEADRQLAFVLRLSIEKTPYDVWFGADQQCFLKSSNDLLRSRLDPHFHAPDVNHLRNKFLARPHISLGAIATLWMPTRFARPKAHEGHGVPFYSSADIMRARRIPSKIVSRKAERYLKQCRVKKNTILICRSGAFGGIMGRATYVTDGMDNWAITEHMIRCKLNDPSFLPEYICALLASMTSGYPLITAYRHGKDVPELDPEELAGFPVPILSKTEQERVAVHIKNAYKAVNAANEMEEKAINMLMSAINWHHAGNE